ncbi:MAG: chorismate mutase [Candidatus Methylacidiphilales bacterium]
MNIPALRQQIDQLDQRLLALLNERAKLSSSVGRWKQAHQEPIFVPEREEDLLRKLEHANEGPLTNSGLRAIYREILSSSRACQKSFTVAFLGAPHSVAWHAVRLRFGVSDRVLPVGSVAEMLRVLDSNEAEVALLSRNDLLKAYMPKKGRKGLLRNELGKRLFICGDVRLADVPASDGTLDAALSHHAEDSEHHDDAPAFALPAGDDDISYLSTQQTAAGTSFISVNGHAATGNGNGNGANGTESMANMSRKAIATAMAPGVEDMFLLLSRRPTPPGPNLKTLVYMCWAQGDEDLVSLRDLLKTAGIEARAWDTLPYGAKPGQACHLLEMEGAVPPQAMEEALRPANRKLLWMEHLGSYPETQVYG